jgi:hypothetical protein
MLIYDRRKFLKDTTAIAARSVALTIPGISIAEEKQKPSLPYSMWSTLS